MNTQRYNITLPKDIGIKLKSAKNKSALIAVCLREKFEHEGRQQAIKNLEAAYKESAEENRELVESWDVVSGDCL